MHPLNFSVKRAHWAAVAHFARLLAAANVPLTPGRLDMLRIVAVYGEHGIPQFKLVQILGCRAVVVSRILDFLEDQGWIRRSRTHRDKRVNMVTITSEGYDAIVEGLYVLDWENPLNPTKLVILALGARADGLGPPVENYRRLNRLRLAYGDRAAFLHPWRRADVVYRVREPLGASGRVVALDEDDVDDSMPDEFEYLDNTFLF